MIITAVLSWWNEKPEDLEECVRSLPPLADRLIALDGAYQRYPGATIRSSDEEVSTIGSIARSLGIDCLVLQPDRLWTGEVEKRSYLLNMATINSDWVLIVDADYVFTMDAQRVRDELEQSPNTDVVGLQMSHPISKDKNITDICATNWHKDVADTTRWFPLLFRALPGLRVERFHWWYCAEKNGITTWLGDDAGGEGRPKIDTINLSSPLVIEHRTLFRSPEQILAARAWYNDRARVVGLTDQENAIENLPEPQYDYETLPF